MNQRTENAPLPNFLIIGAQKCATTWLWKRLREHPEVYLPSHKELNYFCYYPFQRRGGWQQGLTRTSLAEYRRLYFSEVADEKAIGEATPAYFWVSNAQPEWLIRGPAFRPDTPTIVRECLGTTTKLLVILRNPVLRAISAFHHHKRLGTLNDGVSILDAGRHHGIVHMGFYGSHLRKWMRQFNAQNFKILILEQDLAEPAAALRDVFGFLSVERDTVIRDCDQRVHVGDGGPPISRNERNTLMDIYDSDIVELEKLLQRDLSVWRTI